MKQRGGLCPAHAGQAAAAPPTRHRWYDTHARDREAKRFYDSARWQRARNTKLAAVPWCERCTRAWASHVHHRKPLKECSEFEKVDQANLMSVCPGCHNTIEAEERRH